VKNDAIIAIEHRYGNIDIFSNDPFAQTIASSLTL
jgi:hypothetical protein